LICVLYSFFFHDTPTTEIYTLSLHDALPILGMTNSEARLTLTRRTALAGALGTAALATASPTLAQATGRKPNVLFIMADDLGYADLGCYGRREYTTPVLDRLASEGMMFMHAYANSAVCTATRVGLITGRYQ